MAFFRTSVFGDKAHTVFKRYNDRKHSPSNFENRVQNWGKIGLSLLGRINILNDGGSTNELYYIPTAHELSSFTA